RSAVEPLMKVVASFQPSTRLLRRSETKRAGGVEDLSMVRYQGSQNSRPSTTFGLLLLGFSSNFKVPMEREGFTFKADWANRLAGASVANAHRNRNAVFFIEFQ